MCVCVCVCFGKQRKHWQDKIIIIPLFCVNDMSVHCLTDGLDEWDTGSQTKSFPCVPESREISFRDTHTLHTFLPIHPKCGGRGREGGGGREERMERPYRE